MVLVVILALQLYHVYMYNRYSVKNVFKRYLLLDIKYD